jgi:hypothetical protein
MLDEFIFFYRDFLLPVEATFGLTDNFFPK